MIGVRWTIGKAAGPKNLLAPVDLQLFGAIKFAPSVRRASEVASPAPAELQPSEAPWSDAERAAAMARHPSSQIARQAVA